MTYLEQNSCYTIVMNRFREIASVRLPGNRFRRRHMSPKGIRPGMWSRRWTVNLVTAGGARRAVAFTNQFFLILVFENLYFFKIYKKKILSDNMFYFVLKTSRSSKKWKLEKKFLGAHMRFLTFDDCNLYQNHNENLAFATRASHNSKKYLKNQVFTWGRR